ncbi:MogA/MoaB family molybdenum cofactor biosynthesis protein [Oleidesulfovibrio sp.]|uniref:MogA/MoaB family molybdenum cofactor biosynthesis protein n=1 Tax=Oleidesulfovibrio sp. TaxID=2909707 RepID=UPI003A86CFE3
MQSPVSYSLTLKASCSAGASAIVSAYPISSDDPLQGVCAGTLESAKDIATGVPVPLRVGTVLADSAGQHLLRITGRVPLVSGARDHAVYGYTVAFSIDAECGVYKGVAKGSGLTAAWVTLSDKGAAGQRVDSSGPTIGAMFQQAFAEGYVQGYMLPDDGSALKALLVDLALTQGYDFIFTTGGTGLGPRDVTPEATLTVIEKRLHGFEHAMMAASLCKTPHAVISRAVVGTLGHSIIVNMPGSRKAVTENLEAVLPALAHAVAKLQGDKADCGT